jgi:hypothetical protein
MATAIVKNNLLTLAAGGKICTSFGIKICRGVEIVHIAKASGYDSLFIDLEHTCMTIQDASQICITAVSAGVTPFVRVPHECGVGLIQKALDVGAMGVIIPHIHGVGMCYTCICFMLIMATDSLQRTPKKQSQSPSILRWANALSVLASRNSSMRHPQQR